MKHTRKKSTGIKRHMLMLSVFLVAVVALILGAAVPGVWAQPIPLDDSTIIIETNFTDGDAGIQVFLDGEAWNKIQIKDPNGKKIFDVKGKGSLKKFGLTELFLESEEPNFLEVDEDAITLEEILDLFPEGDYEFKGKSVEKDKLEGTATLSHDIPCGPDNLVPAEATTLANGAAVTISWDHVTVMLNDTGDACSADPITVDTYQVIVENVDTENEFSVHLSAVPAGNQVTVPAAFIEDDTTYKYEVLAIADNGNQTIAETWFCMGLASCPDPDP